MSTPLYFGSRPTRLHQFSRTETYSLRKLCSVPKRWFVPIKLHRVIVMSAESQQTGPLVGNGSAKHASLTFPLVTCLQFPSFFPCSGGEVSEKCTQLCVNFNTPSLQPTSVSSVNIFYMVSICTKVC